jgi:hypothetical protein
MELVDCPTCDLPSEVESSSVLDSTDGPVEHLRIRCVLEHRFLLPRDAVA